MLHELKYTPRTHPARARYALPCVVSGTAARIEAPTRTDATRQSLRLPALMLGRWRLCIIVLPTLVLLTLVVLALVLLALVLLALVLGV